jgi:hypothetical protein
MLRERECMRTNSIVAVLACNIVLAMLPGIGDQGKNGDAAAAGEAIAAATDVEQQRKPGVDAGSSPMPDKGYDFWHGEGSLIDPVKNSLDSVLAELCQRYAKSDTRARASMRGSIKKEEIYTLLRFSGRASVFAIREHSVQWVRNGLSAIAMIEGSRTDFRDILMALSLPYHSANRIGQSGDRLLLDAAALSDANMSKLIVGFVKRAPLEKELRASWGHDEVETKHGIGFIGWEFQEYNPTYNLKKAAIEIADLIATDKYQPDSVSVASELPRIWLESQDNNALDRALKTIQAGANVFARLRPGEDPNHDSQMFVVFLVEVNDESASQVLLDLSKRRSAGYSMFGVKEGRLFCLAVARSFVAGVSSFETTETLSRFSKGIGDILRRSAVKG